MVSLGDDTLQKAKSVANSIQLDQQRLKNFEDTGMMIDEMKELLAEITVQDTSLQDVIKQKHDAVNSARQKGDLNTFDTLWRFIETDDAFQKDAFMHEQELKSKSAQMFTKGKTIDTRLTQIKRAQEKIDTWIVLKDAAPFKSQIDEIRSIFDTVCTQANTIQNNISVLQRAYAAALRYRADGGGGLPMTMRKG